MRRLFALVTMCVCLSVFVYAQTTPVPVVGGERVGFTQPAPDLATANGYRTRVYVDGVRPSVGVAPTCTGTVSPFVCEVNMPTLTTGNHNLTITSALVLDATTQVESVQSAAIAVQMLANGGTPATPTLPRIIRVP